MKKLFTFDRNRLEGKPLSEFEKLLLGQEILLDPEENELVEGTIVAKDKSCFIVDIGRKSDSFAPFNENPEDLEVGGTYTFLVVPKPKKRMPEGMEDWEPAKDDMGVKLSYNRASGWLKLREHIESGEVAAASVFHVQTYRNGGASGVKANIFGMRAFIPRRELSYRGDLNDLIGQEIPVKVLTADPTQGRFGQLIVSHRQASEMRQDAMLATLNQGDIVTGVVHKLISAGVLVDLGGEVTGMIHRSEVSLDRNAEPSEVVKVGDEVEVRVLHVNAQDRKVSLSMRSAGDGSYMESLSVGEVKTGIVSKIIRPGVLVDIDGKATGLVHRTELSGTSTFDQGSIKVGDKMTVKVLAVDLDKRTISLSRRAALQEPFLASLKEGDVLEGEVACLKPYGAFVSLNGCIDGLLHNSDIAAGSDSNQPKAYKHGEKIQVKVLKLDLDKGQINLTTKGLSASGASDFDGDKVA